MEDEWMSISDILSPLYGDKTGELLSRIRIRVEEFIETYNSRSFSDDDFLPCALITYPNSISDHLNPPLTVLHSFLSKIDAFEIFGSVHILPFFPWDTDRGFSVIDFNSVHSEYGSWNDVSRIANNCLLMVDFVCNHASIDNSRVQNSLLHKSPRFALAFFSDEDQLPSKDILSLITRPRSNPVLVPFKRGESGVVLLPQTRSSEADGHVWCTFSRSPLEETRQVDMDYRSPDVFFFAIDTLLNYINNGASLVRIDAAAYMWKNLGSSCIHENETFRLLHAMQSVIRIAAPHVRVVTEVNEPQMDTLRYLTDGKSDFVYQFTHFPLAIHALLTGNNEYYVKWMKSLDVFEGRQFIPVLGTHDGLGMKPLFGILPEEEISWMKKTLVDDHGALPNSASLPGGKEIVYELCGTPWSLLTESNSVNEEEMNVARIRVCVALGMSIRGLPAVYINGVFGTSNSSKPLDEKRSINREVLSEKWLLDEMGNSSSKTRKVFDTVSDILSMRKKYPDIFAYTSPTAVPVDVECDSIIACLLHNKHQTRSILSLINLTHNRQEAKCSGLFQTDNDVVDIFDESYQFHWRNNEVISVPLPPYSVRWLLMK